MTIGILITLAQHERIVTPYLYSHPEYTQWTRVEGSHLLIDEEHIEDIRWAVEGVITANEGGDLDLPELNAARGLLKRIQVYILAAQTS